MDNNNGKSLHILTFMIIVLGIVTSATGLLYNSGGKAFDFINQYGDVVKINGNGLYAHDSYFMVPIFRGTDISILLLAIPLLIIALVLDIRRNTLKYRLFLTSVIAVFAYYSANIAFGVTYNVLHLVYIALFSASLFGLINAMAGIDKKQVSDSMGDKLPYKGIYVFLVLTGVALTVAWMPDIIISLIKGRSLETIEVYTTAVTYVLDIGIITPTAFICLFYLKKRNGMGYVLLEMLLTICCVVGAMLPVQTVFQMAAGIEMPLIQVITKTASFVLLAFFALFFNIKFFKNMKA